jgi:hypothetical protein
LGQRLAMDGETGGGWTHRNNARDGCSEIPEGCPSE